MQFTSLLFRSNIIGLLLRVVMYNVQLCHTFMVSLWKANKSSVTSAPSFTVSGPEPRSDDDSTPNNLSLLRNSWCWLRCRSGIICNWARTNKSQIGLQPLIDLRNPRTFLTLTNRFLCCTNCDQPPPAGNPCQTFV